MARAPKTIVLALLAACSREKDRSAPPTAVDAAGAAAPPVDAAPRPALPAHDTYPDLGAAMQALIGDDVRVVGFGELHSRADLKVPGPSSLARFAGEVMPVIGARTSDLVLETWVVDPKCQTAKEATPRVEAAVQRPAETKSEIAGLVEALKAAQVRPLRMELSCDDWSAIAPPKAEIDLEAMLTIITRELGRQAMGAVAERDHARSPRRLVAVYGGALHNDLYPQAGIEDWSYAAAVDRATGGKYLEIDLLVPALVADDPLSRQEPWFPLIGQVPPDVVTVVQREARSYVVLLPR